jgi:hypothetical protein
MVSTAVTSVWSTARGGRAHPGAKAAGAGLGVLPRPGRGTLGCAGLWLRRRWPVGLGLALVALSAFSDLVAGAMVVVLFSVAVHRPRGPRRPSTG